LEENFARFNFFAHYKEKEMDFRRWFTALAVLALFAGLASAQVAGGGGTGQLVCNSVAQVTPLLRSEGVTELVGDIVITCTGGTVPAAGAAIPTANITVSLTAPVTSRIMNVGGTTPNDNRSEALLLIDEPGSGLPALVPSWGPAAAQRNCPAPSDPLVPCAQFAAVDAGTGITIQSSSATAATAPINVFQGIVVSANQVQFRGVPILPTGTSGFQRVFRITNIRVNASAAGSSIVGGVNEVRALISTSNPAALPISAVDLVLSCCLKKSEGPSDIRRYKRFRCMNGTVDMSLSGKIDYRVDSGRQFVHQLRVADIPLDETIVIVLFYIAKVIEIARIRQFVEIYYPA
jgi:hypothetical protein